MPDTILCPQCGDPARITERFWLDSTDGPVEHLAPHLMPRRQSMGRRRPAASLGSAPGVATTG
jgi:hypothetical protein